jgi:hypothetical protein
LSSSSSLQHHHRRRRQHIAIVFFFSNIEKKKHIRKQQQKTKRREGAYLQALTLPSHFWLLFLPFRFKHFLLASSSSQTKEKKNTQKEKKTIEKKKKCRDKRELYLQAPDLPSHFWLLLLPFCFKRFLLTSSSSQTKQKKKKTIERTIKLQKREGAYLPSLTSAFGMKHSSCFLLYTFFQR